MDATRMLRYQQLIYMVAGTVLGMFLGYQVLPQMFPTQTAVPTAAQMEALHLARAHEQAQVAASLEQLPFVPSAQVSVIRPLPGARGDVSAVVTIDAPLAPEQVERIADKTAQELGTDRPGRVSVFDGAGRHLNAEMQNAAARKEKWRGVAINVAKVLGILAALITLRYVLTVIGRSVGIETPPGC